VKNIGVLGGTFDPPHEAHLKIAERSLNQFKLDKIIFIPSGNPWQKKDSTPYRHRFEMTKILIKNSDSFALSDLESSEQNPSYTYETLEKLQHPKENLYFILGSDTAMNIKTWKNYGHLSNLTQFLIALRREDSSETLSKNFPFDYELIEGEKLDLSSTGLREKLEENKMNNIGLPSEIFNYIKENKIY
jgi:nicotinate-nucleotide adenylyltransferase